MQNLTTALLTAGLLLGPAAAAAAPGRITSLAAQPASPATGQPVTFQIGHSGQKCGFVLDPDTAQAGDANENKRRTLRGAVDTVQHTYSAAGARTVQITGKKNGDKPACQGGPVSLALVVQSAGTTGGHFQAAPAPGGALTGPKPQAAPAPPSGPLSAKGATLEAAVAPSREITAPPRIEALMFIPDGGGTDPGVLAPGGRVMLIGERLGESPGRIVLKGPTTDVFGPGYRYGEVELLNVRWEDTERASGHVPADIDRPLDRTAIEVRVVREDGGVSAPYPAQFEVPNETRWLDWNDVAVAHCGQDSNNWACNGVKWAKADCGFVWLTKPSFDYTPESGTAIEGYHKNCTAAVGDDAGTDRYRIQLSGGWVFDTLEWKGERPAPDFPEGGSLWVPSFDWKLSPGTDVHYWAKIRIRRPTQ